ncbi:gp19 [Streptomyces phage phiSASD1]|uniref:Gp19 n=1 Tax=Streptomyces phage phiSASD1 TaxID=747763 RepID=D7NW88_9CAUD|nr:gp19 [Streptomyces phage phiSASD1]ADE43486.1 gp19 [Streptomyces phage phiSASD1]
MSSWTLSWVVWLAAFVVIEGLALLRKRPDDTLSEHVWRWFAVARATQPDGRTRLRRFMLLAGMSWLSVHFLTGGWV